MGFDREPITSSFLECRPIHTTSYCVTYPLPCTRDDPCHPATYTVKEKCWDGKCRHHKDGDLIPGFAVTTFHCDHCKHPTQTITCPNAAATGDAIIWGDGITVTIKPTEPTDTPDHSGKWKPDHGDKDKDHGKDWKPDHGGDHGKPDHGGDHGGDHGKDHGGKDWSKPDHGGDEGGDKDHKPDWKPEHGGKPDHGSPTATGHRPIVTAGAPSGLSLKNGMWVGFSLAIAAGNFFLL